MTASSSAASAFAAPPQPGGNPFSAAYSPVSAHDRPSRNPFALYDDAVSDDGADTGHWETEPAGTRSEPRFYNPRFYAAYFDITVSDLATRLFRALVPYKPLLGWVDADEDETGGTSVPDLYAPVWVTTTLVLALSMGAKCANFLANVFRKKETASLAPSISSVEFSRLWRAASVLYFYVFVFPVLLTLFQCLFAKRSIAQTSVRSHPLVGTVMVYGYSMTPVVVAAFISTLPIRTAQVSSMAVAFCIGAFVIMLNLWRDVSVQHRSLTYFVRLLAVLAHVAVGVAMVYIFFLT